MCEYWKLKTEIWNLYVKCLESEILRTKMSELRCVYTESWKLKFEICMWNVWNLKFWELKCLNWDVWIFKAKNWNLKFLCKYLEFQILKIKMSKFGLWILKVENWNMKYEISLWNVRKESKVLKTKIV
jgi:hypothetical protein